ncbi:MAG: hydrogenase expression protein, partial [Anaerolineae bacterium]|nr:hydrogenase expression protein [Anaerolineae bacterium]
LERRGYSDEWLDRVAGFLHDPGISVLRPALLACDAAQVHAMHDPTEGGLATGLLEISRAADVGLEIDLDAIPILPEGQVLCREFGLDPLGVIASGALVVVVSPEDVARVQTAMEAGGYPVAVIGRVLEADQGIWAVRDGRREPFPRFRVDEIARLF